MKYYKIILPNNKVAYINSNNFAWYSSKLNTFIGGNEYNSEYIIVNNEVYRLPWLKFELKQAKGKYPEVSAEYATEDEYNEYINDLNKEK